MSQGRKLATVTHRTLGETLHWTRLESGLGVYVLPHRGFHKRYATCAVNYGSVDNRFLLAGECAPLSVPDGIAHFLEHQLFAEETGDIFDRFARLGAAANAYTQFISTTYLFSTTSHFFEALELLMDLVWKPYITDATVAKEKGIIEQEVRMYQDTPRWRVFSNLLEALYHRHPVRIDIAGTVESVRSIDTGLLLRCYRAFYQAPNMVVFVVADEEPATVVDRVERHVARLSAGGDGVARRVFPEEKADIRVARTQESMSVSEPLFRIGFKEREPVEGGTPLLKRILATELLWDMLLGRGSELFNQLYDRRLLDDSFSFDYMAGRGFAVSVLAGQTTDPEALHQAMLDGIARARTKGLNPEDFARLRNRALGQYLRQFDHPEDLAHWFNFGYFHDIGLFDFADVLQGLTLEDVHERLAEHLDPDYHALSVVLPPST